MTGIRRKFLIIGACSGFLWVLIGAITGHHTLGLVQAIYLEKAQRYQIVHTLALLIWASLPYRLPAKGYLWTGILWIFGVICFSGTLYSMALTGITPAVRYIVPVGGTAFLAAWALSVYTLLKGEQIE